MRELYRKSEMLFAFTGIGIYMAGTAAAGLPDGAAGTARLFSALFHGGAAVFLLLWIRRNGLTEKYGLVPPRYQPSRALFFLPLILTAGGQALFGRVRQIAPGEAAASAVSMLSVGFLEEILFRGFLLRAAETRDGKRGILLSAAIFSLSHLVNLTNGQPLPETAVQVLLAFVTGLTLALLFSRGGSLIPCIAFHSLFNLLSVFFRAEAKTQAPGGPGFAWLIQPAVSMLLLGGYAVWIRKRLKRGDYSAS